MLLHHVGYVIFAIFANVLGANLCPDKCICIDQIVRCMHMQLLHIPSVEVPNITTLDLRYNEITEIKPGSFSENSIFGSLKSLLLNNNNIARLENGAFLGIEDTLQVLDLYGNRIEVIDKHVFLDFVQLEQLYLHSNNLKALYPSTFANLPKLKRLFLSNNNIERVPFDSFRDSKTIKYLRLDNNPISCDCDIVWLLDFIHKHAVEISATCRTPKQFNHRSLKEINESDFNCSGDTVDITAEHGQKIMLNCETSLNEPLPDIHWIRDSEELTNNDRYTIFDNGSLLINAIDETDRGQYECMMEKDESMVKMKPKRTIIVQNHHNFSPVFVEIPENVNVDPGSDVHFKCKATGTPAPELYWSRNDVTILRSNRVFQDVNGGLRIQNVNHDDFGTYRCHAANSHGRTSVAAQLKVLSPPIFTIHPQNQNLRIGQNCVFECYAVGDPIPVITWYHNDLPVRTNYKHLLEQNNSRFTINNLQHTDNGVYVCKATNSLGSIDVPVRLDIRQAKQVLTPRLSVKPYDKEVILGTTIEIPCKLDLNEIDDYDDNGDENEFNELPEITWRKDGTLLPRNTRYRVSATGSLYITNFADEDTGRYECSVLNEAGHDSGVALISIKPHLNLKKIGDQYVKAAFAEAQQEIDRAVNNTVESLFNRKHNRKLDSSDLFRLFRYPNAPARELAKAAEVYDRTLLKIREFINIGLNVSNADDFDYKDILSKEHLNMIAELSGCMPHRQSSNCTDMCYHRKYRTISGLCNNLQNPTWGASLTSFRRLLKPLYENGFSTPVGWNKSMLYYGYPKPSSRLISTTLISTDKTTFDNEITHMVMQWGQFLDHDLDHAIPSVSSESWDGIDCKKSCNFAAPCYPIEVPKNDPRIQNRRCIDFFRSSAICGSGTTSVFLNEIQVREQINQLTAFIDGSQVYGFSDELSSNLRDGTGKMREGLRFRNKKGLLPFSNGNYGMDCRRNYTESDVDCFLAGDIRVNEQIGLTAMHTLWMREHNRIVDRLQQINPHWPGEFLFQEARKIVGAEMQHITYKHWLPLIVGDDGIEMLGEYRGYNSSTNPSISNVFATAALRFGHTIINPIINRYEPDLRTPIPEGHLPLHKGFFAPWRLTDEGGIDPILRGLYVTPAKLKRPNENLNSELTEKLFQVAHAVALDLAAINIQRSRDHGLPGYLQYRKFCNLNEINDFDDLQSEISDYRIRDQLRKLYGHPGNIDVWVGGILEDVLPGAKVGPLFRCLLVEQFQNLRDGDRFYYEYESSFEREQLAQIRQSSLARIICDNADNVTYVAKNVFLLRDEFVGCETVPQIDLRFWSECCETCSLNNNNNRGQGIVRRNRREIITNSTTANDNHDLNDLKNEVTFLRTEIDKLGKRLEQMGKIRH